MATQAGSHCSLRAPDLVDRDFSAVRPAALWLADFTYLRWEGVVFFSFIVDLQPPDCRLALRYDEQYGLAPSLNEAGGRTEPFHGWLELISILHGISNSTAATNTAKPNQPEWSSPAHVVDRVPLREADTIKVMRER